MALADLFIPEAADDPTRFSWTPSTKLLTPAGTLQGGAGLGAAMAAMSMVTGRPLLWATAQYLSYAMGTAPLTLEVTVEVAGHNTTQARCILSRDGSEVLTAHAALGSRDMKDDGVWAVRPLVPPPDDDADQYMFPVGSGDDFTQIVRAHLALGREDHELTGRPGDGNWALWMRLHEGVHDTSMGECAVIADFAPMAFGEALGSPYSGNSLDNTIRIGHLVPTEWVLLSVHVTHVMNGFGHVHAELWAEDGTLLAHAAQSSVVRPRSSYVGRVPGRSV